MEKEYVIQNLDEKRAQYLITNPNLILEDIQTQINTLMEAGQSIREFFEKGSPSSHQTEGVFQYNSDRPLRVALLELLNTAQKRITIMFGAHIDITNEALIPTKLLKRKVSAGVDVTLLLFIDSKNWKTCVELHKKNAKVYHLPQVNTETMIHLIDNDTLCISTVRVSRMKGQETVKILQGQLYRHLPETIKTYDYLLKEFLINSTPLESRLDAIKKDVIYPEQSLRSIFE